MEIINFGVFQRFFMKRRQRYLKYDFKLTRTSMNFGTCHGLKVRLAHGKLRNDNQMKHFKSTFIFNIRIIIQFSISVNNYIGICHFLGLVTKEMFFCLRSRLGHVTGTSLITTYLIYAFRPKYELHKLTI